MRIAWKTGLVGLATGSLLAAALAGTLILHRAAASQPPTPPESRAVAPTWNVIGAPDTWLDDSGGVIPRPPRVGHLLPRCQPDDLSLTLRPDRTTYASGQMVTLIFDARFKGSRPCGAGAPCLPEITVWNAGGKEVWHWSGEVGGGACAGAGAALLTRPSQHLRVLVRWRQDDCGLFCNEVTRSRAAPAGHYTATASWPPNGSSPRSEAFTLD